MKILNLRMSVKKYSLGCRFGLNLGIYKSTENIKLKNLYVRKIFMQCQCRIHTFLGEPVVCLVSPWDATMISTEAKFSKICLSGVYLVLLHVISAVFFVIKLVVIVLAYIMSDIPLVLKGQKILLQSFLVRLENFLEFYLLLIGLFFSRRQR